MSLRKVSHHKTGFRVELSFSIGLHKKDEELLKLIQGYFGGIGIVSVNKDTVL